MQQLANRCEMLREQLSRIESGKREPRLSTLERIASALDLPLADLIAKALGG